MTSSKATAPAAAGSSLDAKRAGSLTILGGVPEGYDALVLARLVAQQSAAAKDTDAPPATILHVARDDRRLDALETAFKFFAPKLQVMSLPAWDSVPFDRIGPNTAEKRRVHAM